MNLLRTLILAVCLFVYSHSLSAQNKILDSLQTCLQKSKADTNRAIILQELCKHYIFSDAKKALLYGRQSVALAEELHYLRGSAKGFHNIGVIYYNNSEFDSALFYFSKSLVIKEQLGDRKGMASTYNNIGAIVEGKGDAQKAMEYYLKSLKIYEDLHWPDGAMAACNNVGNILAGQHDNNGALKYYRQSLMFARQASDKEGEADAYHNIGSVHNDFGNKDSALLFYRKGLVLYSSLDDRERISATYNTIGQWFKNQHNYDSAIVCFDKALLMNKALENKVGIIASYHNLGTSYLEINQYDQAEKYLLEGLPLVKELGLRQDISLYYEGLASLYAKKRDYFKAYSYHLLYAQLKDSLINTESLKQIASMNTKYDTEKKEQQIKLLNKDKEIQDISIRKQNTVLFSVIGGLLVAVLFSFFIFRSLRITRKQKHIIEKQKMLVEEKNQIVEEKNKDIIDSINYARRIQLALLKDEEHIGNYFPEHFILFRPKDIVSGDFYWGLEKEGYCYLAAADCTGHGVPGAFMSVLGVSFLNEITSGPGVLSPAEILDQLRDRIVKELGQTGKQGDNKDGMDISLARFNKQTRELQWAGANNPLYMVRNDKLTEVKGNKQPIGFAANMQKFSNQSIELEKGDCIYLFTDGFADQFGGPKGKKFKYSQLKEILFSNSKTPMKEQKRLLDHAIETWKGNLEQTDDVCLIGVRL